jgi:hypothetical protein
MREPQLLTKALAKAGQTKDQSAVFHCSALVRAGQATLNFLLLTSTKYFQSSAVVGRRTYFLAFANTRSLVAILSET